MKNIAEKRLSVRDVTQKLTGPGALSVYASLVSILAGLIIGYILLLAFNPQFANYGFENMMTSGLSKGDKFAKVLYQAAPLIFVGVAVGFAFKTGLFNIGATGQYTVGAFLALVGAIQFQLPWYLCLVLAMIGGAVWGIFPGLFKALFNVNEVITAIMFNWISLFMVNLCVLNMPKMLANFWGPGNADRTAALGTANPDAILPRLYDAAVAVSSEESVAALRADNEFLYFFVKSNYMNIGIVIAIIFAIIAHIILNKTTFGYELKACGNNKNASIYAGIDAKRNIILSMVISGAFAGIGGGVAFLSGTVQYTIGKSLLAMGFNGIPVALLGASSPIGIIFSALFISYIQVGGDMLQPEYAKEIIDIIISAIIYLSAFSLLMKNLIERVIKSRKSRMQAEAAVQSAETLPKQEETAVDSEEETEKEAEDK